MQAVKLKVNITPGYCLDGTVPGDVLPGEADVVVLYRKYCDTEDSGGEHLLHVVENA